MNIQDNKAVLGNPSFLYQYTKFGRNKHEAPIESDKDPISVHKKEISPSSTLKDETVDYLSHRSKAIQEAKHAFLNSTINTDTAEVKENIESNMLTQDILSVSKDKDSRSTGGGENIKDPDKVSNAQKDVTDDIKTATKRNCETPLKVSFKIKNGSHSHKKNHSASKQSSVTVHSSKVADLTKKFNEMIEDKDEKLTESDFLRSVEKLQKRNSNNSSPSSTINSNGSIKIIVKKKVRRRNSVVKKKSASSESLDKLLDCQTPTPKRKIDRSKSENYKKPPKKQYNYTNELGNSISDNSNKSAKISEKATAVKQAIAKIECDNFNKVAEISTSILKPAVPEKRNLTLTKNLVIKDGKPKIKSLKLNCNNDVKENEGDCSMPNSLDSPSDISKKSVTYEKSKYKTNYIHKDKLTFSAVEIIPEEISLNNRVNKNNLDLEKQFNDIASKLSPNQSFLWSKLNKAQIYQSDLLNNEKSEINKEAEISDTETQKQDNNSNNDYFIEAFNEGNIIEALNDEVIKRNNHSKLLIIGEGDYEILDPVDGAESPEYTDIISTERPLSKINCPLPEIPKEQKSGSNRINNVYQSLIEMRSHPEGDESSIHSYETYDLEILEERTRGDGDSDDGYEYCKTPVPKMEPDDSTIKPLAPKRNTIQYGVSKSTSSASTVSYEKIGSDAIYEKIPPRPKKTKEYTLSHTQSFSDYSSYNDGENIYDTIKHPDGTSLSHCYESIPSSPGSIVKLRNAKIKPSATKRLSYDTMSNFSQTTMSSEQKTNSIYGQRSVISFSGQEVTFPVASSETSEISDRSDDWVDISEPEEENSNNQIIIVQERCRGRKSPVGWSQKVRHQWQKSPKRSMKQDCDSSDSGHYYESLNINDNSETKRPVTPIEEDFDSFDSDSDVEPNLHKKNDSGIDLEHTRLPDPPPGNTLTKIASAASKKMKELSKRYSKSIKSTKKVLGQDDTTPKPQKIKNSPIYANLATEISRTLYGQRPEPQSRLSGQFEETLDSVENITPSSPTISNDKNKNGGTLSRKTYFSFKTRFRRSSSMAVDLNSTEVPGPLKITNSTFYLTDSIDGDSGFSNCSDSVQLNGSGSAETLPQQQPSIRKRSVESGTVVKTKYESSPNLTLNLPERNSKTFIEDLRRIELEKLNHLQSTSTHYQSVTRPLVPPPPPPTDLSAVNEELKRLLPSLSKREKKGGTRTSWYAECGLETNDQTKVNGNQRPSSTSWYADMGLYWTGSASSSSGASSASPTPRHHPFIEEPLYQFYNAAKLESICRETTDSDSEGYEAISELRREMTSRHSNYSQRSEDEHRSRNRSNSRPRSFEGSDAPPPPPPPPPPLPAFSSPPNTSSVRTAPNRTLWCQLPEVVNSPVLSSLSTSQKRLQEAKFEILTSEASYLNSLLVLENHFINHPAFRDDSILTKTDWEILFGTILPVRKCSQQFMSELEKCWKGNILLHGLCDVIKSHAEKNFDVYIKYCENQIFFVKTLQRVKAKPQFMEILTLLESHPACQSLSLYSFLMLPMQRVTRMPLLVDAMLRNLDPKDEEFESCQDTLATLNSLVSECNEGTRNMERVEEMFRLASSIEFPPHMKGAPELAPSCRRGGRAKPRGSGRRPRAPPPDRHLVRSGALTQLIWREDHGKLTFGRKVQKIHLHVFLFTDVLVITKKKSDDCYIAVDYCQRSLIEISTGNVMPHLNIKESPGKHLMLLSLLQNCENKTVEMIMSCASESDSSRWVEAVSPTPSSDGECIYGGWDCPQVAAVYCYSPSQPDELALSEGDIVNVSRKMPDGWYYGERTRDGETGWFPGNYTIEVASPHVRARNLKQRYRLLALSASYIGQKKRTSS